MGQQHPLSHCHPAFFKNHLYRTQPTAHSPQPTSASPSGKGELAALENQDPPAPVLYTWAIIIGVYFGSFWSKLTAFPVSITVMGTASPSHPQLLPVREEGCNLPWGRGEWAVGKVS